LELVACLNGLVEEQERYLRAQNASHNVAFGLPSDLIIIGV